MATNQVMRRTPCPATGRSMQRRMARHAARLAAVAALGGGLAATAAADILPYTGVPAPAWTAMFVRTSGWTGADGVYSYPLSGVDAYASGRRQRTFIVFSDTFVGDVDADGHRLPGTTMVHNSSATMSGLQPGDGVLDFHVRTDAGGAPTSMVAAADPSEWLWPTDGVVQGGQVFMSGLRVAQTGSGGFGFAVTGTVWLVARADEDAPFLGTYRRVDAPELYHPAPADGSTGDSTFGSAVMPLTAAAHAPFPDGWIYVYGARNDPLDKKLLVARVRPGKLLAPAAYRYWTGLGWSPDIAQAAPMTDRVASEFSVTPLPDGRYLLVFQLDTLGRTIAVRYGASPTGPWGPFIRVYDCPEATLTPNTYVYGAKAHPHLSSGGNLLISYHVNTFKFIEQVKDADIYHPRFITVPLNP